MFSKHISVTRLAVLACFLTIQAVCQECDTQSSESCAAHAQALLQRKRDTNENTIPAEVLAETARILDQEGGRVATENSNSDETVKPGYTLHAVANCGQCGAKFCSKSSWKRNSANVEAFYGNDIGVLLAVWGCDNYQDCYDCHLVRNSQKGIIYIAEFHPSLAQISSKSQEEAGNSNSDETVKPGYTLHAVANCGQCGAKFCSKSSWKRNSANVEAFYGNDIGAPLAVWGCDNYQDCYDCHLGQCGAKFCSKSSWKRNSANVEAFYGNDIGAPLAVWGCDNYQDCYDCHLVRNSQKGIIYIAEFHPNLAQISNHSAVDTDSSSFQAPEGI